MFVGVLAVSIGFGECYAKILQGKWRGYFVADTLGPTIQSEHGDPRNQEVLVGAPRNDSPDAWICCTGAVLVNSSTSQATAPPHSTKDPSSRRAANALPEA